MTASKQKVGAWQAESGTDPQTGAPAPQALAEAEASLRDPRVRAEACDRALLAIATVVYSSPSLPGVETVRALASAMRSDGLPDRSYRLAADVLRSLLTTSCGREACREIIDLLAEKNRPAAVYEALLETLQYAAAWVPERLDADSLVALLALDHLRGSRRWLAENVIEPCLYRCGDALTIGTFDRFAQGCAAEPFFQYFCNNLAARRDFPPAVRERASAHLAGRFGLHDKMQAALGGGPRLVLMLQNIRDGQGDEIVRCVPLLQALLDSNPQLEITLITGRGYLYSHSRVAVVPIRDRARIEVLLREPHDAAVDFFEPNVIEVNYDPELEPILQSHIEKMRPRLVLSSTKGYNHFLYERFELDGCPLAGDLRLDRQRVENTYETTFRLIAELGLPLRCGEDRPISEPVLTGLASPDAEAAWTALTSGNTGRRPVALLNPFGGLERVKGYIGRTMGSLALEMRRLIAEGYYVVLLANGAPWSSPALLEEAMSRLAPAEQAQAIVAPDRSREADLFLRFIRLADLIVAVEGWAVHVAYCLGKPYRILMLPLSHPASWQPYLTTRNQRVDPEAPEQGDNDEQPPLPQQPRKFTLLLVLRELARQGDAQAVPFLRRALGSEDREIRLAAARSLDGFTGSETDDKKRSSVPPVETAEWMRLLDDPWFRIRAAAAAALLRNGLDGLPLTRDRLEAYGRIAARPRDWRRVLELGDAARPALEAALDDDDPVMQRESRKMLQILDMKARFQPRRTGIRDRLARLLRKEHHPEIAGSAGQPGKNVLILTPVKDAAGCIDRYYRRLAGLTYPHAWISLGFLESDSQDTSYQDLERHLPYLRRQFRRAGLWRKDFGYRVPAGVHRGAEEIQAERRSILARSRNHLLLHALDDEDWVMWLDADVIDYPNDIIERLLATGKDIVQPHCVLDYGGPTFDRNAWRDKGSLHLDDLRAEGELVELHAVGGTMLLVRADLHRDGLVFPAAPYGKGNPRVRNDRGELETEGLGIMAQDMGHQCWGMPRLEIRHRRW